MKDLLNWIASNKNWIFEGVGVYVISGIIGLVSFLYLRNKGGKKSKNETENTVSNTVEGDGNYTAGRDINVINPEKKKIRPLIELELLNTTNGIDNLGASAKNPSERATFVTEGIYHFDLNWIYYLVIRNNSSSAAYGLKIDVVYGKFNYIDKYNALDPLLPHGRVELNCQIRRKFEGKGRDARNILSQKYPDEIKNLLINIKYMDEDRHEYTTQFKIVDGNQINDIL